MHAQGLLETMDKSLQRLCMHVCVFCQLLCTLRVGRSRVLINEVVTCQSVITKGLQLVVLAQWQARIRFYAL